MPKPAVEGVWWLRWFKGFCSLWHFNSVGNHTACFHIGDWLYSDGLRISCSLAWLILADFLVLLILYALPATTLTTSYNIQYIYIHEYHFCTVQGVYFMYLSSISTHKVHPSIVMYADSERQVKKEARWMTQIAVPIMAANLRIWNSDNFLIKFGQSRLSLSLLANFSFSFDKARSRSSLMFTFNQLWIDHWCFQTNIFHWCYFYCSYSKYIRKTWRKKSFPN